jgi:CheY-like chemotaxis protein
MQTLGILFRSEGYDVCLVEDGVGALREASVFRPQVALLDLEMPGTSGHAVAHRLRSEYGNDCPVLIAVTGMVSHQDRERADVSGFQHFIAKPYDPAQLLRLVASLRTSLKSMS